MGSRATGPLRRPAETPRRQSAGGGRTIARPRQRFSARRRKARLTGTGGGVHRRYNLPGRGRLTTWCLIPRKPPRSCGTRWVTLSVMWWQDADSSSPEGLAREAVFARTIDLWVVDPETVGDKRLSKLMEHPRDSSHVADPTRIAWLGCGNDPPLGMFTPRGLVERRSGSAGYPRTACAMHPSTF